MLFPITELLSREASLAWIEEHFHPDGLRCPKCQAPQTEAYVFRQTKRSELTVYRCKHCLQVYNLYSRTIFEQRHLKPEQVILLIRGVLQGTPSTVLALELDLHYQTVLELRRDLQTNAQLMQMDTPLIDTETETDEMFQNAGEKR